MPNSRTSLWLQALRPRYPRLETDLSVDVAVVGAGITGLTTAWMLQRSGVKVALLDAGRVGQGATGATSAHLTQVPDRTFSRLLREFGESTGRLVAEGYAEGKAIMLRFTRSLEEEGVFLQRVPAYRFGETEEHTAWLEGEAAAAQTLGVEASVVRSPSPFAKVAVCFPSQAQLHPILYLNAMARKYREDEGHLFEGTRVQQMDIGDDSVVLSTRRGTLRAGRVVLATHTPEPFQYLISELTAYTTYLMAFEALGPGPDGIFWDVDNPYHYWRSLRWQGRSYVLVGGEDHRTGRVEDAEAHYERLEEYARARFQLGSAVAGWHDEIYSPIDGLPYIGRTMRSPRVLVATGFAGNGLAAGSLAARMLSDEILGKENPWQRVFSARRLRQPKVERQFDKLGSARWAASAWPDHSDGG